MATQFQIQLGAKLDIDISLFSQSIASAMILDAIGPAISENDRRNSTDKQISFAATLDIDVSKDSLRVASARISDILAFRNLEKIKLLNLKPGDLVAIDHGSSQSNDRCTLFHIISSINKEGLVYFKGGNGQCSWASRLRRPTKKEIRDHNRTK